MPNLEAVMQGEASSTIEDKMLLAITEEPGPVTGVPQPQENLPENMGPATKQVSKGCYPGINMLGPVLCGVCHVEHGIAMWNMALPRGM